MHVSKTTLATLRPMMSPSVLLLDEPSAGLSPVLTDEAFVRVKEINALPRRSRRCR